MIPFWILVLLGTAAALDDDKIIGGYECPRNSQPWQVYFTYKGQRWCGGSLITSRWIISAAHCYKQPKSLIAHLGEHETSKEEGTEQHIQVEKAYQFFYYNEYYMDHDFMMVKLSKDAEFNQYVQPIKVARDCPKAGSQCLVSGWGNLLTSGVQYPDALQCLNVPVLSDESCKASYRDQITSNMFCAGFLEGGKDSCQGDSGGPLVCNGELYGVVSWGKGCAQRAYPGVYTKVCNYLEWIQHVIDSY
ncbi:cationic trypsin [Pelobates cultripes]|uniref:Cationic trypsin n=1 Tax=Pelobates cultripes TaxID=61616 RepID=A0AAD1T7E3_PELCU|nr:cationic trypsin [Pelobates cultripes]